MSDSLKVLKEAIRKLSSVEQQSLRRYLERTVPHTLETRWGIDASVILDAIEKSSDLSKRGIRGILAEAIFESDVIPSIGDGWHAATINKNEDLPFDVLLANEQTRVRVQVKLQRSEKGAPKLFHPRHYEAGSLYVVEVQKTRTGAVKTKQVLPDSNETVTVIESAREATRPYRFGQFDILAVSMHPSSGDWNSFRYTVGDWLLPRVNEPLKIAVLQPVSIVPNDVWTDDLRTCLEWLRQGEKRTVLKELRHFRRGTLQQ